MKKLLATVSAVVLSLAMVALPSISASAGQETCDQLGYNKPAALDASSGNVDIYDGATLIGNLTWSGTSVTYSLQPGWSISLCIKSGAQTGDGDKIEEFGPLTGSGSTPAIEQDISHIGYTASYTPPADIPVAISAVPQGEQCDASNEGEVLAGSITLTIKVNGSDVTLPSSAITSLTVAKDGGAAAPVDSLVLSGLSDGSYVFSLTVAGGYSGSTTLAPVVVTNQSAAGCVDDPGCDDLTGGKGFSISTDDDCPKEVVTVQGSVTNQTCQASGDESVGTPVNGSITLTVSDPQGVTKIEYEKDNSGSLIDVPLNDLTIDDLAPGSYKFFVTVDSDYESVAPFTKVVNATHNPECNKQTICHWTPGGQNELGKYVEIDVSIKSIINVPNGHDTHEFDIIPPFDYYDGENLVSYPGSKLYDPEKEGCGDYQFPTEGPVLAEALFTPATCSTDGSYTLISPELVEGVPAKTVTWFVNDVETEPGTYPVKAGETITVKVVAIYPEDYPVQVGNVINPEFTYPAYEFTAPTACDLNTLALTGAGDTTPALALTAFLGLLGLAMVRSGMRVNRNRQEA